MEYSAIKELTLLQLGEDVEDMEDFITFLDVYLGRAYWELMKVRKRGIMIGVQPLSMSNNLLPEYVHPALSDYATYAILTNGNATKQSRAQSFYARYEASRMTLKSEDEDALDASNQAAGTTLKFTGLYDN